MIAEWQLTFTKIIKKQKKGFFSFAARCVLHALSWPYRASIAIRNAAYDRKFFSPSIPNVPLVISIGNIVAGGTGKTPITSMFAGIFLPDTRLAVLSRGYRSAAECL